MRLGCFLLLLLTSCLPLAQGGETSGNAGPADQPEAFAQFSDWWQQYQDATEDARPALVKKGLALATRRKTEMVKLIQNDPETALQLAFPEEYRASLPPKILPMIEEHVRGLATLTVTPGTGDNPTRRTVTMDDQSWQAYVYGPRRQLASREEIPIHGVVLEGKMAVDGSPLERFPQRASLIQALAQGAGKRSCPVCGKPGVIPAAAGDILLWFDTPEDLAITEKALIEKEAKPEVREYP